MHHRSSTPFHALNPCYFPCIFEYQIILVLKSHIFHELTGKFLTLISSSTISVLMCQWFSNHLWWKISLFLISKKLWTIIIVYIRMSQHHHIVMKLSKCLLSLSMSRTSNSFPCVLCLICYLILLNFFIPFFNLWDVYSVLFLFHLFFFYGVLVFQHSFCFSFFLLN